MMGCCRLFVVSLAVMALWSGSAAAQAAADPARQVYEQAMRQAASGQLPAAIARLEGGMALLPAEDVWHQRYELAIALLAMRRARQVTPLFDGRAPQSLLLQGYVREHPGPEAVSPWITGGLAALLPGGGHAWLHRWRDAGVAALMVWPMLLLTIWAARRRMGPVTLFFGIITVWFWSGTIFSAVSLAERGSAEAYALWWSGLWQAGALPGRPW